MHGRGDRRVDAVEIAGGPRAARDFGGRQRFVAVDAARGERVEHRRERADLRTRRRGVQRAVEPQLGIDGVRAAEIGDVLHGRFGGLHEPDRLGFAEQPPQRQELRGPREQAAAVAAARAGAAQVGLDDRDVERGVLLLRLDRGPEPGEAAADDAHVGLRRTLQRGGEIAVVEQRLFDPEGSHGRVRRKGGVPRTARKNDGRRMRTCMRRVTSRHAAASADTRRTPIARSVSAIAATAPGMPASPKWPMQPTRNVSTSVSLPGYRM